MKYIQSQKYVDMCVCWKKFYIHSLLFASFIIVFPFKRLQWQQNSIYKKMAVRIVFRRRNIRKDTAHFCIGYREAG